MSKCKWCGIKRNKGYFKCFKPMLFQKNYFSVLELNCYIVMLSSENCYNLDYFQTLIIFLIESTNGLFLFKAQGLGLKETKSLDLSGDEYVFIV